MDTETPREILPGGPDPHERATRLASHFNSVERYAEAEQEALRGLALAPDDLRLHVELARSFIGRERWVDADEALVRLLQVAPDCAVGFNLLCIVRTAQGRYAEAEKAVLEALRLEPDWASPYEVYGDLMRRTAHLAKAKKLYERARALNPEDPDLPSKIALVETQRQRIGPAHRAAAAGLALGPAEALAHASRGSAHLAGGRPFRARADFREALRLDPSNTSLEEAWLAADTACRIVYLPMYYWSLVVDRLPGKQFLVWGVFVALAFGGRALGIPSAIIGPLALAYVAMCLYTWVATPIVKLWLKIVPPKL